MERTSAYWKRFAASVTDYAHRWRFDPFFRTEVNIIGLQGIFALLLLLVVSTAAAALYRDASNTLSEGIHEVIVGHYQPEQIADVVAAHLLELRGRTTLLAASTIIIITLLLSYITVHVALSPTRNALRSQKQFIGNVAHEIRTPLSVIKTNTEVALMTTVDPELKKSLESTVEELDRISSIINNLLSLSTLVRQDHLEFSDVDLGTVARAVIEKLQNFAMSKRIEISARISEHRMVWGNITALEQIAMNIISNAIAFSHRDGRIVVTIEPGYPNHMIFTVQDFGIGIARRDLFRIFEPYYRADPSRRRGEGSSGLGLTIVSELVRIHNGKITVRSGEGRGTTISVLLPASRKSMDLSGGISPPSEHVSEVMLDFSHRARA